MKAIDKNARKMFLDKVKIIVGLELFIVNPETCELIKVSK